MPVNENALHHHLAELHDVPMHPYYASLLYRAVAEICETDPYLIVRFTDGGLDLQAQDIKLNEDGTHCTFTLIDRDDEEAGRYDPTRFFPGIVTRMVSTLRIKTDLVESVTMVPS